MPRNNSGPQPLEIIMNRFDSGVVSLLDESRIPITAAWEAKNLMQKQDGLWSTRWGTATFGATLETPIDGFFEGVKYNSSGTKVITLFVVDNGKLKKSTDDGSTWTVVSGITFTLNKRVRGLQIRERMYMFNGYDALAYYDLNAGTIQTYSGIATPAPPTATRSGSLSAGSYQNYYRISAVNNVGETPAGTAGNTTTNKHRDNWISGTDYIDLTWTAIAGAERYNIYYADASGYEVYLDSVSAVASPSYRDSGDAVPNDFIEAPVADTTTGPKFTHAVLSGNRIWATGDPSNPYRVYWGGTGQFQGAFSPFYGGGYIDLEKGGIERPTTVKHFRSGTGESLATIFTTSPDGSGSTWHIDLTTADVSGVTIVIPRSMKVIGSVGSEAPDAVIEAQNNIIFPSSRGIHNIGTKPQLLNILATDEISVNIRPNVQQINNQQASKMCATYHKGKLLLSVPIGSTDNNQTWVLDLERRNWTVRWELGVKAFLQHTDVNGNVRLLAIPVSGTKLIEISENYLGDLGVPFDQRYKSGIIHVTPDHKQWAKIKYVYVELARPSGTIYFSISGTRKNKSFASLKTRTISDVVGTTGFGSELFSELLYSDPVDAPETFTSATVKKRLKVNKLLNNFQIEIYSNSLDATWTLNQLVIIGRIIQTGDPANVKR